MLHLLTVQATLGRTKSHATQYFGLQVFVSHFVSNYMEFKNSNFTEFHLVSHLSHE